MVLVSLYSYTNDFISAGSHVQMADWAIQLISEGDGGHRARALRILAKTPAAGWQSLCPLSPWGTGSLALPGSPAGPWASRRWTAAATLCAQGPSGPAGDREGRQRQRRQTNTSHMCRSMLSNLSTATKPLPSETLKVSCRQCAGASDCKLLWCAQFLKNSSN